MRTRNEYGLGMVLATAALLMACGDEPTGLDERVALAVAEQAAADAHADAEHMRAPGVPGLRFPRHLPGTRGVPDCPREEGAYVCTREHTNGSHTHRITFFDANGGVQDAYDESSTASIHLVSEALGERDGARGSRSVVRSRDLTVSGLLGEESTRIWNGRSEGLSTRTRLGEDGAGETRTVESTSHVVDVELPAPGSGPPWPLGGQVTSDVVVTGGPREGQYSATVTFDGSQFATVVLNGETFTVDLATRRGRRGGRPPGA